MIPCTNCGAVMVGNYCQACGQKRFVESDRRFGHLVRELVSSATDLDGRVWRSLIALLFKPGLLSREYIDGRRARWISPISLFLAVNVIYFLAPLHGGDLALQFNQQVSGHVRALANPETAQTEKQLASNGQAHTPLTTPLVDERVRTRNAAALARSDGKTGYTYADYRLAYDAKADDVSKGLIILHIPFTALVLMLVFADRRRYFAEHFVVALHFFAFILISLQLAVQAYGVLERSLPTAWIPPDGTLDWTVRVMFSLYTTLALRRAYAVGWGRAVASAAIVLGASVAVNLYIYRAIQFLVTFALT